MEINNLVLELTRRCQLSCSHCLRGEAQPLDMSEHTMSALVTQLDSISTLTFSGGEPSLRPKAMAFFRELCAGARVDVGSFFIATNGVKIKDEFVLELLRWRALCEDKKGCSVRVSEDYFHQECRNYRSLFIEDTILGGLSFLEKSNEGADYGVSSREPSYINQGFAVENLARGRELVEHKIKDKEDFDDADIYVNVLGQVINGCDWSYENQAKHILCDVQDLEEFYESLPDTTLMD